MTLESALLNARILNVFLRHCDKVEIATRSNMANSFCGSTFATNPAGVLRRPCHSVMQIYRSHAKPIPLKVEGSTDGLDVFACASADMKAISVFVVNSRDRSQPWNPNWANFPHSPRLTNVESLRDTQGAGELDVMNHWISPNRMRTVRLDLNQHPLSLPPYSVSVLDFENP